MSQMLSSLACLNRKVVTDQPQGAEFFLTRW